MFIAVVDYVESNPDTINKLIEVDGAMHLSVRDYPDPNRNRE